MPAIKLGMALVMADLLRRRAGVRIRIAGPYPARDGVGATARVWAREADRSRSYAAHWCRLCAWSLETPTLDPGTAKTRLSLQTSEASSSLPAPQLRSGSIGRAARLHCPTSRYRWLPKRPPGDGSKVDACRQTTSHQVLDQLRFRVCLGSRCGMREQPRRGAWTISHYRTASASTAALA